MKIPRSVRLMSYTVPIEIISVDKWQDEEAYGWYVPAPKCIRIRECDEQTMFHAFCHELTHAILDSLNQEKLYGDETFVDNFSGLLAQALASASHEGD